MNESSAQPPEDFEALLLGILDSSLDGIMALGAVRGTNGRIVDFEWMLVNQRAEQLLGRPRETLRGRRLLTEIPLARHDGVFDRYTAVVESGIPADFEHAHDRGNARLWLHTVAVKLGDGVAVTFADLSDRKRLEEQLVHSQKLEIIGRLAGGIAHDFNNLLTAIGMNAELAGESLAENHAARGDIEGVLDGVRRARALTQQLLAFSRGQTLSPRVLAIADLIASSAAVLRRLVGDAITLDIRSTDDPWTVSVDPTQFDQVLTNLAVNAHDAMPQGGQLTLEVSNVLVRPGDAANIRHVPPGAYVRLEAADTGMGIPLDVLPHVFEPFFTTKGQGRGTGLGLATSYGIVRKAGGHMWATSTVGRGASFTILLPRAMVAADTPAAASVAEHAERGTERVLIVDDDPQVLAVVSRTLTRLGYRTASAQHGREALRMLADDGQFDLVVSDIVMPHMGGRELRRAGRARFPRVPIMLMSGYDTEAEQEEGFVLKKPFSATELARAVRDALASGKPE